MISESEIRKADILIVDDQEADAALLEQMLLAAGYLSVSSTRDPYDVCELHRKNRYGLILLDLQMFGLDGFQVMEGLIRSRRGINAGSQHDRSPFTASRCGDAGARGHAAE